MAKLAIESGCNGLVASPFELTALRSLTKDMTIVTPGIRIKQENEIGNQSSLDTPSEAIKNGASFILLGRAITQAANKRAVIQNILASI